MLRRILAVASNTRKEAFRNRAFLVLIIFGVVLLAAGWAMSKLAVQSQRARVIQDFGFFAVSIVTVVTAVLMGVILLYKELDKKTIYTLIPKPVLRLEILLGKFVGLVSLLVGLVIGLGLFWLLFLWWHDALEVADQPVFAEVLKCLFLVALEAMLITSLALLFSSWTRPVLSGMFTFGYFLMGRWVHLLQEHLDASMGFLAKAGPVRTIAQAVTYLIPDLQTFNTSRELALGIKVHGGYLLASAGYACSFTVVFLVIGIALFQRRDFV
jgi:ABC-type transport system involved in multi-copper enzyme maturation permease subunit